MTSSSYTPTVWNDDAPPPLSAANLNHLEGGVEDAHERIDALGAAGALRKTLAEFASLTPSDTMEVALILDGTAGVLAHLKYRTGSPNADKWENLGGGKLCARSGATTLAGTGSYADPGTLCSITIPRSGRYRVRYGAWVGPPAGNVGHLAIKKGSAATSDSDSLNTNSLLNGYTNVREQEVDFVAGDVVKLQGKAPSGTLTIYSQFLEAEIIRCS